MDIIIKGKAFPGDFYDADFIEHYEKCVRGLSDKTAAIRGTKHATTADGYRALCRVVEDFFDEVFGPGSAAKIFEADHGNVRNHLEAVEELNGQAAEQRKGLNDMTNKYAQKQAARAQAPAQVVPFDPNRRHGKGKRRRR